MAFQVPTPIQSHIPSIKRTVYRASRAYGIIALIIGLFVSEIGLAAFIHIGLESWYFFGLFIAGGAFVVALGWQMLLSPSVELDQNGITWILWFGVRKHHMEWDAIECWLVSPRELTAKHEEEVWAKLYPRDMPILRPGFLERAQWDGPVRLAIFKVRGNRWPYAIDASEVCRPGFDAFIGDVRTYAGDKEMVIQILQNPTSQEQSEGRVYHSVSNRTA
ncbi:MAG: hypothetical protein HY040_08415 [Planctomycetes bacterium]|nr:hypothetical protein [Planctomycetota bacterium]